MRPEVDEALRRRLGADRVLEPRGYLPQAAARLDASGPVRAHEFEVAVDWLDLDATSFRNIRERSDGDPARMAARILEIVAARGKMHNPETSSGGVLLGAVSAVGETFEDPPAVGQQVVPLMSLTNTPLRLEQVLEVDPHSALVPVRGTAYVYPAAPWAPLPSDVPAALAVELFDVYPAASYTRELTTPGATVCVLGAGAAGRLACAAAQDEVGDGTVIAVDVDGPAVSRLADLGLCDIGVEADLRDPLAALAAVRAAGGGPADLTVAATNARGCEAAAMLLTADDGQVIFFSMATAFDTVALTPDGISTGARMIVGTGFASDLGSYALDLFRRTPGLRRAMGHTDS